MVVSPEYSSACLNPFPAALDVAYSIMTSMRARCPEFAHKKSMLFVAGEEAGGNIAAGVALMARDQHLADLKGQILLSPMLDPASPRHLSANIVRKVPFRRLQTAGRTILANVQGSPTLMPRPPFVRGLVVWCQLCSSPVPNVQCVTKRGPMQSVFVRPASRFSRMSCPDKPAGYPRTMSRARTGRRRKRH